MLGFVTSFYVPSKAHIKRKSHYARVQQVTAHHMGLQVSCGFHSQVSEEVIIWGIKARDRPDFPRVGKAKRVQSRGGVCDAGSCAYVTQYTSEMFRFQRDWLDQGQECYSYRSYLSRKAAQFYG